MFFGFVDRELSEQTFHENRIYAKRQLDTIIHVTEQRLLNGLASLTSGHVFKKRPLCGCGIQNNGRSCNHKWNSYSYQIYIGTVKT